MKERGYSCFIILVAGSAYFLWHLLNTKQDRVFYLGLYVAFVAIVFGVYLFLQPEPRRQQPDEKPSATDKES